MRSSKEAAALQSKRAKVARQPGGRLTLDQNSCGAEQGRNDDQRVGDGLLQRKRAVGALGEWEKETPVSTAKYRHVEMITDVCRGFYISHGM